MSNARLYLTHHRRTRLRVVAWAAVVAAVLAGFLPGSVKFALHAQGRMHDAVHFVVFFAVAVLLNRTSRWPGVRVVLALAALLLGFVAEFGEHLVFGMWVEWRDVVVDGLGALTGSVVAEVLRRRGRDGMEARRWRER